MDGSIFTAPWYPWYVNDVLTSEAVDLLSLAEEGAYRRALDKAWKKGSIPSDPKMCARMIGKQCSVKIAEVVLTLFTPMSGDPTRAINPKLESVRAEQKARYNKRAMAGQKGGIAKAMLGQSQSNDVATAKHSDSDIEDSPKKEESEETPQAATPRRRGSRIPDQFFLTTEMKVWAKEKKPCVDLVLETEKFCNHFRSASGRTAVKLDWTLTWKNWILNSKDSTNGSNGSYKRHDLEGYATHDERTLGKSADFYANYDEQPVA